MISKDKRTVEEYEEIGAFVTVLKNIMPYTLCELSKVLYAKDADKLIRVQNDIYRMIGKAEDQMFQDHPELGGEYLHLFYGGLHRTLEAGLHNRIYERVNQIVKTLFTEVLDK